MGLQLGVSRRRGPGAPLIRTPLIRALLTRALLVWLASTVVLFALLAPPAGAAGRWTDISDEQWIAGYGVTAEQVSTVAAGYADGTFRARQPVSRGHFAKMAVTGLGLELREAATPTFSDVATSDGLFPWIEGAAAAGLVTGYEDGTFRPQAAMTRQQAGSLLGLFLASRELSRAGRIAGGEAGYPSLQAWYSEEGAGVLAAFADAAGVAQAHAAPLAYLVSRGVMRGVSAGEQLQLDPLGSVTRAQAVALILRAAGLQAAAPGSVEPFVSTAWLEANLDRPGLVVIDLRSTADYAAGHIPRSLSVPWGADSAWARPFEDLSVELPAQAGLFETIGRCGIAAASPVVLVGGTAQTGYPLVDTARVAFALMYAGVEDIGILQGGFRAWSGEGRPVTTDVPVVTPVTFDGAAGTVRADLVASTAYLEERLGAALLVDTRSTEIYSGAAPDTAAPKAGHIPTAVSLPVQSAWQADGTYAPVAVLAQLAAAALGSDRDREVIVYCSVGGTASCWWFVLSQVLGYNHVRLYDGSAQAWVKDHDMVTGTEGAGDRGRRGLRGRRCEGGRRGRGGRRPVLGVRVFPRRPAGVSGASAAGRRRRGGGACGPRVRGRGGRLGRGGGGREDGQQVVEHLGYLGPSHVALRVQPGEVDAGEEQVVLGAGGIGAVLGAGGGVPGRHETVRQSEQQSRMGMVDGPHHHGEHLIAADVRVRVEEGRRLALGDAVQGAHGHVCGGVEGVGDTGRLVDVTEGAHDAGRYLESHGQHDHLGELLARDPVVRAEVAVGIAVDDASGREVGYGRVVLVGGGYIGEAGRSGQSERRQRSEQGRRDENAGGQTRQPPSAAGCPVNARGSIHSRLPMLHQSPGRRGFADVPTRRSGHEGSTVVGITRIIAVRSPLPAGRADGVQDAIPQLKDPVCVRRDLPIVRGDQHGHALGVAQVDQMVEDGLPGLGVDTPGGLVGEDDRGVVHQGPGDRGPLSLPARDLGRQEVQPVGEPHFHEHLHRLLAPGLAGDAERVHG